MSFEEISYSSLHRLNLTLTRRMIGVDLFSIIVVDGNRNGPVVSHALNINEQPETLYTVLDNFKKLSRLEEDHIEVKTVIIVKDTAEISAVKETNIVICKFHVIFCLLGRGQRLS